MLLEIDIGNTSLKWRIVDADQQYVGRCEHYVEFLGELNEKFGRIGSVRIACVAQDTVKNKISARVLELWGVTPQIARTQKTHAGLEVAYQDPSRLGVDRWLAMLAAFSHSGKSVCVIDCGSAVTVDLVDEQGVHLGGYIVPGVAMQEKALLNSTGQIRLEKAVENCHKTWGKSTEEAVNFGVLRQAISFIDAIVDELLRADFAPDFFITGGDAEMLLPMLHCRERFQHYPDLVLDGLAVALS